MIHFLKIVLTQMTGKDVMSDVVSLAYVVLREAEKHVPYGECVTL